MENVTDVLEEGLKFTWWDYSLFGLMLATSALIGVYFGFFGKKQTTAADYLLGGKEMNIFPIAMSLIACNISGITILAVPADVYKYGWQYIFCPFAIQLVILVTIYTTMPVFHNLQLASTNAYLELRFDSTIKTISSLLYTINMFMYLPIVIYVPALALAQGTGFNVHYIAPIVCGVCIFYTTIGGLKAVVWTDALQTVVMIGSMIVVTYLGTSASGGITEIFNISSQGGRLDINYSLDPTIRDTIWTILIGAFFGWMSIVSINQGVIQKCLALPSIKDVKKAFIIFALGMLGVMACSVYTGLMIYSRYQDCDPLTSKKITVIDQLLPYYVMDVAGKIPGLPGLFIAGVFSAALSSLSATMNSLSCTLYEDFISGWMPKDYPPNRVSFVLKWIVAAVGIICTALVFVVEHLGSILQLVVSLQGITSGSLLALFLMGMFIPSVNAKGAFYGAISSLIFMTWVGMGGQYHLINGNIVFPSKETSIAGCMDGFNATTPTTNFVAEQDSPFVIYRISFYYYTLIGLCVAVVVALPVSWLSKDGKVPSSELISPLAYWAMRSCEGKQLPPDYYSVEKAMELVEKQ